MPKSKHRKSHSIKLSKYKVDKKKEQEVLKKKMIDNYIKMQQEILANKEEHTSTEEVAGPDININELNEIVDWEPGVEVVESVDVDTNIDFNVEINDNNN